MSDEAPRMSSDENLVAKEVRLAKLAIEIMEQLSVLSYQDQLRVLKDAEQRLVSVNQQRALR